MCTPVGRDAKRDGSAVGARPTIRDVARLARVSTSTVSAVLNGTKFVRAALRDRVEEAVASLGYRPNLIARALHGKRTRTLACLVPSLTNPFFSQMAAAVDEAAHEAGYSVLVGAVQGDPNRVAAYVDRLLAIGVDGALVSLEWNILHSELIPRLLAHSVPVVGVGGGVAIPEIDCLLHDDQAAGEIAGRYLLGLGHRQIAFLGNVESRATELRYTGLSTALRAAGIDNDPALKVEVPGYREDDGMLALGALMARNVSFTAVVAVNDIFALGTLNALETQGLTVPAHVSLVGFGDTISSYTRPKLTTIAYPKRELGIQGARRLLARVVGDYEGPTAAWRLPVSLVVRESTRVPWEVRQP